MIRISWAANQDIRMISEGSCDTEDYFTVMFINVHCPFKQINLNLDWSNDAENLALTHRNKLHFKTLN